MIDDSYKVILHGQTRLEGNWVNNTATIAYPLWEKNVFIVGYVDSKYVQMVKIRVTGEKTFDWIDATYNEDYPKDCAKQMTFLESCFEGPKVTKNNYNVVLVARL